MNQILGTLDGRIVTTERLGPNAALTPEVRLATLAVICGYSGGGSICVRDAGLTAEAQANWQVFLKFILDYPIGTVDQLTVSSRSPEAEDDPYARLDSQRIVLASGGLDSTATMVALRAARFDFVACWVNYGQPYASAEQSAIRAIANRLQFPLVEIDIDLSAHIAQGQPKFGHIVPGRNVLLVTVAAAISNSHSIYIASLLGEEVVPDKSDRFYDDLSSLLDRNVVSPFREVTKADIVGWWTSGSHMPRPQDTISCYSAADAGHRPGRPERHVRTLDAATEPEETGQNERPDTWLYRVISFVAGSKVACVVDLTGFELWT